MIRLLVPHSKEKGKPYVLFTVAFSDISNIEELVEKLDSNKTEICYYWFDGSGDDEESYNDITERELRGW